MAEQAMTAADVAALARTAGLSLSAEREAALAPVMAELMATFAVMEGVALGETPPAFGYDPRPEGGQ